MPSATTPYAPGDGSLYASSGKFGGPKAFAFEVSLDGGIDSDTLFHWLRELGVDPDALDRVFSGHDPED